MAKHEPTFDEELLLWLGDEPPGVRAADAARIREITAEFALGFDALASVGPAVSVFGSARTPPKHRHYVLMREVGAELGRAGFAVITGGGGGLTEAANRGAPSCKSSRRTRSGRIVVVLPAPLGPRYP